MKFTTPDQLLAENNPVKVAANESLPAIGTVCVMVRVNIPDAGIETRARNERLEVTKAGTGRRVQAGRSQTGKSDHERVAHTAEKSDGVGAASAATCARESTGRRKVTGSAFALDVPSAITARSSAPIAVALKISSMFVSSFAWPSFGDVRTQP